MKYVVDVSAVYTDEWSQHWEDAVPVGCGHLKFSAIKAHKYLFVVENATDEDLMVLSLIGITVAKEISTVPPEETDYPSSVDYLIQTSTEYIIMKLYYGKLS